MHRYQVYGLSLEAEFPFPELELPNQPEPVEARSRAREPSVDAATVGADFDLRIRRGSVAPELASPAATNENWVRRSGDDNLIQFEEIGRFCVHAGRIVTVDALAGCDPALLRHVILGPVLAQVLWQRGLFGLHASVLQIGAQRAAFVGESGAGKSTTAVALHAAGHRLICDDVAALDWEQTPVLVRPSFPRIRACADTLRSLGESAEALTRVHPELDKWFLPARQFSAAAAAPLDRIYVLAIGPELEAERLTPANALLQLVRHTYYGEQFARLYGLGRHMQMAGRLASQLPVYRLTRPRDFARLPELVGLLEHQAAC